MMFITRYTKRRLHRDICADPLLHGLVLNLYLNGEEYPHRVSDYFPIATLEDCALADRMRCHMREEDKHVALYRKAIQGLGQPIVQLPLDDVFNHVIRHHTPTPLCEGEKDNADARLCRLANFLAHLHFLEARIVRSLEFHVEACVHAASDYPEKAVAVILADEREHAAYTRDAVMQLLPRGRALAVLGCHREAEAKANLDFSARQLGRLLHTHADRFPARRRWLYRAGARILQEVVNHG